MPLPSGQISFSQVNVELGLSATAQISLNDAAVRTLAGVPSGAISMQNLQGKANASDFASSVELSSGAGIFEGVGANGTAIYVRGTFGLSVSPYTTYAVVGSYSPTGTVNWLKSFVPTGLNSNTVEEYKLLGLDSSGNIYVVFRFGSSSFDLLKINASGTLVWGKSYGFGYENASISVDSSGNIYASVIDGGANARLIKIDTNGGIVWAKQLSNTTIRVVHVSSSYVYVGGITYGSPYTTLVYRFDLNGNVVDNRSWNAGTYGYVGAINTDSSENIYIGLTRDLGGGAYQAVYQRYNSSWTFNWTTGPYFYFSGTQVYPREIVIDSSGNSYCTLRCSADAWVTAKMNSSGTVQWIRKWTQTSPATNSRESWNVAVTSTGKIVTSGFQSLSSVQKGFFAVVPADGSKTGAYTLGGTSITYAASAFTYTDGGALGTSTVTRTISNITPTAGTNLTITPIDLTSFVKSTVQL